MINIGDTIILEPKNSIENEKYRCKLVEKKGELIYIDYPVSMDTGKTAFLLEGHQLKGSFVGKDNTVYLFETEVKARVKNDIPMIVLSYPGEEQLVRIQRRQFVRVDTSVDIAAHPIKGEFTPFVTITSDISAGGAALILPPNGKIKPGTIFNCWVTLPMQSGDYHYLVLKSKAIRIIPGRNEERDKMPIEFVDISNSDRQLLIRFSFETQINFKRKGIN
ncbi:c-di-GMP-binding flagellar brake protein YcgR [Bacillus mesophilus]|uniref:Pilus assembly protein PilZ n=1 Tax=Bacillus mesophilus TaxID=1808955 RepID=A0A6M0Q4K4_9BACI|nr:flagellar brake domain-containing protein [Bacillus mesophilus]MBM7661224.1 c-di-GMP-binding flagellar brake protein YcgR [Bacillus mesophilus]NEY71251.1 pilus assembly protein PilZ [Bacillus mesophilus]